MLQRIKNFLKKFLPPPVKAFNREVERILTAIKGLYELVSSQNEKFELLNRKLETLSEENKQLEAKFTEQNKQLEAKFTEQNKQLEDKFTEQNKQLEAKFTEQNEQIEAKLSEQIERVEVKICEQGEQLEAKINSTHNTAENAMKYAAEATWAEIFNNTITDSVWLKNKVFSPGRWALGYPALYAMYRVLNEFHPKRILELGLGQSTRMIAQYAAQYGDVEHTVVEHDEKWISFFKSSYEISEKTNIVQLEREFVPYKEADAVRVFKGFSENFKDKKFDFIVIDAPLGGDMKQYARIDVLSIIPDSLAERFVIVVDDTERAGERRTITEIENLLKENKIKFSKGLYSGKKDSILICDAESRFLTSM